MSNPIDINLKKMRVQTKWKTKEVVAALFQDFFLFLEDSNNPKWLRKGPKENEEEGRYIYKGVLEIIENNAGLNGHDKILQEKIDAKIFSEILTEAVFPFMNESIIPPSQNIEEFIANYSETKKNKKHLNPRHADLREKILGAALRLLDQNIKSIVKYSTDNDLNSNEKTSLEKLTKKINNDLAFFYKVENNSLKFNSVKLAKEIDSYRPKYGLEDDKPAYDTILKTIRKVFRDQS